MKYAAKRVALLLVTMVVVSFLAFASFSLISGNAAEIQLGTQATPERVAALEAELGLDRPLLTRYGTWLLGFFTGNLGQSLSYHQNVGELIAPKLQVSLCLTLLSFLLIALVSIPVGLLYGSRANRPRGGMETALNQLCMAVPPFFIGILLSWFFGILLHWFIPGAFPGLGQSFSASLWYLLFPATAIAIPRIAMTVRMLRGTVMKEMNKDYVRTAISRGNDRRQVLTRHVLKNSLLPIVTFLAQTMAEIVAGGIVVEQVFGVPGLGRLLVVSISNRDFPVVQAIVVILAFWVVLTNTLADLVNGAVDPRLRLGGDR